MDEKVCPDIRNYIVDFFRSELDEVYINGDKIPFDGDYVDTNYDGNLFTVSGYGLNATWDLDELVDKLEMILKETEKDWCELNDSERREYVSKLFTYGDEI